MKDKDIKRNKGRPSGFVLSDETKSKIANGLANKPKSDEHKANMSKASLGKPKSDEHKANLNLKLCLLTL